MSSLEALPVLSSMFTPVVLINACGLILLSTSQRLSRQLDRLRRLADLADAVADRTTERGRARLLGLKDQIGRTTRRANLQQRSLAAQYVSICLFIATVIAIAAVSALDGRLGWVPVGLALAGVAALFYASILLIVESREAFDSVKQETENALLKL
ncbi:MAG: DUF2721 domain-containing protein [Elusimicrobiota bacterium]